MPPPCKLTPLLLRLSFAPVFFLMRAGGSPDNETDPGRRGESVFSKSESDSPSDVDSEKGKRPRASSINEMPSDHTSDLTVYWAPCIRSGCVNKRLDVIDVDVKWRTYHRCEDVFRAYGGKIMSVSERELCWGNVHVHSCMSRYQQKYRQLN